MAIIQLGQATSSPQGCGRVKSQFQSANWNGFQNCQFIRWPFHQTKREQFCLTPVWASREMLTPD
jgi:hypothetical protein